MLEKMFHNTRPSMKLMIIATNLIFSGFHNCNCALVNSSGPNVHLQNESLRPLQTTIHEKSSYDDNQTSKRNVIPTSILDQDTDEDIDIDFYCPTNKGLDNACLLGYTLLGKRSTGLGLARVMRSDENIGYSNGISRSPRSEFTRLMRSGGMGNYPSRLAMSEVPVFFKGFKKVFLKVNPTGKVGPIRILAPPKKDNIPREMRSGKDFVRVMRADGTGVYYNRLARSENVDFGRMMSSEGKDGYLTRPLRSAEKGFNRMMRSDDDSGYRSGYEGSGGTGFNRLMRSDDTPKYLTRLARSTGTDFSRLMKSDDSPKYITRLARSRAADFTRLMRSDDTPKYFTRLAKSTTGTDFTRLMRSDDSPKYITRLARSTAADFTRLMRSDDTSSSGKEGKADYFSRLLRLAGTGFNRLMRSENNDSFLDRPEKLRFAANLLLKNHRFMMTHPQVMMTMLSRFQCRNNKDGGIKDGHLCLE